MHNQHAALHSEALKNILSAMTAQSQQLQIHQRATKTLADFELELRHPERAGLGCHKIDKKVRKELKQSIRQAAQVLTQTNQLIANLRQASEVAA